MYSNDIYIYFVHLDRYAFFKSSYSENLDPQSFDIASFFSPTKAVTFWVKMQGSDCGTLFVRMYIMSGHVYVGHKTLFETSGDIGTSWRKVTVQTDLPEKHYSFYVSIIVNSNFIRSSLDWLFLLRLLRNMLNVLWQLSRA